MDGIPTTRWKSIQWMEIPPRVGWISNYLSQNRWSEFQPFFSQWQARFYYQFSTFPLWSFQNYESESGLQFTRIWRFSSVEMRNSLEQYRASIGWYHSGAGAGPKRNEPDVFWVALKDLLLTILVLQCLIHLDSLHCSFNVFTSPDMDRERRRALSSVFWRQKWLSNASAFVFLCLNG